MRTDTAQRSVYSTLSDEQLGREAQALERRVSALRLSSTAAGAALYGEFRKRLDEARLELSRRASI